MAKSTVTPPRRPRKEDPAVTIANQERQIRHLTERTSALVKERDEALKQHGRALEEIQMHKDLGDELCGKIAQLEGVLAAASSSNQRMLGWQDCAREMFSEMKIST